MSKGMRTRDYPNFIYFKATTKEFRFIPSDPLQVGNYPFQIDLKDHHKFPKKKTYNFLVIVTKFSPLELARIEANLKKRIKEVNITRVEITDRGLLEIQFSQTVFKDALTDNKQILQQLNKTVLSSLKPTALVEMFAYN